MKKALILVVVLALALGISYLVLHKNNSENGKTEERDTPLAISSKSAAFNNSVTRVLNSYYALSEGFSKTDSSQIVLSAQRLDNLVDSIRFDQFRADTAILQTAVSLAQSMKGDIAGLMGEKTMEQKKREFNMITDQLYSLVRTVSYDGNTIYHIRCPTAFSDSTEAYWLSPSNKIVNPYRGKNPADVNNNMQDCGEVIDSVHFSGPLSE
jgi:hypothetical protein